MRQTIILITLFIIAMCSCQHAKHRDTYNGVYYWKTTFNLDSTEYAFLKAHNINRVYLRMFDVSVDEYLKGYDDRTGPQCHSANRIVISTGIWNDSLAHVTFMPVGLHHARCAQGGQRARRTIGPRI